MISKNNKSASLVYIKYTCFLLCIAFFLNSCGSVNQLKYFKNLPDSSVVSLSNMELEPRIIQIGDRLQVTIGAKNPEAAAVFNSYGDMPTSGSVARTGGNAGLMDAIGYAVNEDGSIEFPVIGKIQAVGLTGNQFKDILTEKLKIYLRDPLVNVRFLTFKFTVLGEVRAPGTFVLSQQRTTLLDALGAAGDLPRSAKRYDIQLYRDYNGIRTISKIDLRDKALLNSPELFHIRHNDVIIVQPRDIRLFSDEARTYISLLTLIVGTISTVLIVSTLNK